MNDTPPTLPPNTVIPRSQQVCDDVVRLWKEEPAAEDLPIDSLYRRIIDRNQEWSISREHFLEVIKRHNLVYDENSPSSRCYDKMIEFPPCDVKQWNKEGMYEIRDCQDAQDKNGKGRGVYALKHFKKGDMIFEEKLPIVIIPPMEKLELMSKGKCCTLCGKSLYELSTHYIMMNGLDCNDCTAVWCSKNCKKMDSCRHSFLKHVNLKKRNHWYKFENFCKEKNFVAGYSVGIIYATILLNKKNRDSIKTKYESLAQVSQRIRIESSDSTNIGGTLDASSGAQSTNNDDDSGPESVWEQAYKLFKETFPTLNADEGFSLDDFLLDIGKFNINQLEGQIYHLYSFINHNCEPNIRYEIDSKLCLRVFARKPIQPGEELLTTYVNPLHGVKLRRRALKVNWGFLCQCARCENGNSQKIGIPSPPDSLTKDNVSISIPKLKITLQEGSNRRKSSMRDKRPDLTELLKNGKEFDLEIPDNLGSVRARRRTSVRFDENVSFAIEE